MTSHDNKPRRARTGLLAEARRGESGLNHKDNQDMFSNYDKRGYLRARKRQERMAETLSGINQTDKQIKAFMRREERLQTYEFISHPEKREQTLDAAIDFLSLFKISLKARIEKITFDEYVEKMLETAIEDRRLRGLPVSGENLEDIEETLELLGLIQHEDGR